MNPHDGSDKRFLDELRTRLRKLGDESPPAPRPNDVLRGLRRRRARRFALTGTAVAAALMLAAALWLEAPDPAPTPGDESVSVVEVQGEPEEMAAIAPLPLRARSREVHERIAGYLEREGIERILVEKRPGEELSFALAGSPGSPTEIRRDLEILFENFSAVRLNARPGVLSYSLTAQ